MPWLFLHAFTQDDALAIASYLKTLPAVRNQVPAPLHYGFVETVVAKLLAGPPAASPTLLSYADGNFGQTTPGLPRDLVQRILTGAQWLVLLLGAVLFLFVGPPERRVPRGVRGGLKAAGAAVGVVILGVIGAVLYATPTLRVIPPEQIAAPVARAVPQPIARLGESGTGSASRSRAVLVHRGVVRHVPRDGREWWPQGELGAVRYTLGAERHVRLCDWAWELERSADRPRHPRWREPRRQRIALAGDDLGPRVELGRRGHPGAGRLPAKSPAGAACDSGSAPARSG
jgi:hypothetical protein